MATVARFPPGFSQFRWWYWLPVGITIIPSTILYVRLCLTSNKSVRRDFIFEVRMWLNVDFNKDLPLIPNILITLDFLKLQITFNVFLIYFYLLGQFIVKDQPEGGDLLISSNGTFFPKFYYYGTVYFYFHAQVRVYLWWASFSFLYECKLLNTHVKQYAPLEG